MMDGMTYEERAQITENRLQKLEGQIERLIAERDRVLDSGTCTNRWLHWWDVEVRPARELIK